MLYWGFWNNISTFQEKTALEKWEMFHLDSRPNCQLSLENPIIPISFHLFDVISVYFKNFNGENGGCSMIFHHSDSQFPWQKKYPADLQRPAPPCAHPWHLPDSNALDTWVHWVNSDWMGTSIDGGDQPRENRWEIIYRWLINRNISRKWEAAGENRCENHHWLMFNDEIYIYIYWKPLVLWNVRNVAGEPRSKYLQMVSTAGKFIELGCGILQRRLGGQDINVDQRCMGFCLKIGETSGGILTIMSFNSKSIQ